MPEALLDSEAKEEVASSAPTPRKRRWLWLCARLALLGVVGWLLYPLYHVYFAGNFHEVLPGDIYRSAQHSPTQLKRLVERHGIRTVVNLRGLCSGIPWYMDQCAAVQDLGINQEDLTFSAKRMPSAQEIRRLIEVLDRAERPILFHCRHGADRTGLAAVVTRILYTDDTFEEALGHLGWRYGHFPIGHTQYIDRFFDLYADWLRDEGRGHSPVAFRAWVADGYNGGWLQRAILSVTPLQEKARFGHPVGFCVKLRNISSRTWHFSGHEFAGVHLAVEVIDPSNTLCRIVRGGLYRRDVKPGEEIDINFVIPALKEKGTYRMRLDMMEEDHCWFQQAADNPYELEFLVHE